MALIAPQSPSIAAVAPTYVAVAASDTIDGTAGGRLLLHIKNAGASPDNVVIDDPNTALPVGGSLAETARDVAFTVTNAQERMILIDVARFTNQVTGLITITHSFTTSVTIGIFRV